MATTSKQFILFVSGRQGDAGDAQVYQLLQTCPPEVMQHVQIQQVSALPAHAVPQQAQMGGPVIFDTVSKQFSDPKSTMAILQHFKTQALGAAASAAMPGNVAGAAGAIAGSPYAPGMMPPGSYTGSPLQQDQQVLAQQAASRAALLQRTVGVSTAPGGFAAGVGAGMPAPIGGPGFVPAGYAPAAAAPLPAHMQTPAYLQQQAMQMANAQSPYGSMSALLQGYNPNVFGTSDRHQRGVGDVMNTDPRMQPGTSMPHASQMGAPYMAMRNGVPMGVPPAPYMGVGMMGQGQQQQGGQGQGGPQLSPDQLRDLTLKTVRFGSAGNVIGGAMLGSSRIGSSMQQSFNSNSAVEQTSQMESMAAMDAQFAGRRTGYNILNGRVPDHLAGKNLNGSVLQPEFNDRGPVDGSALEAVAKVREEHTRRIEARQRGGVSMAAMPGSGGQNAVSISEMKRIAEARSSQAVPAPRSGFQPAPLTAINDKLVSKMGVDGGHMLLRPPIGASGMYGPSSQASYGGMMGMNGGGGGGGMMPMNGGGMMPMMGGGGLVPMSGGGMYR